jgi:hypothetical protein
LSTTSRRRIWIIYYKSEEDQPPSIEGLPYLLTTRTSSTIHNPIKWPPRPEGALNLVGQSRAPEGHRVLQATRFLAFNLVGLAWAPEGHGVLQATRVSPPFCAFNLVGQARASDGHGVLQATRTSPLFCAINPDNLWDLEPFQEGTTLDYSMTTSPSGTRRPADDYFGYTTSWERDSLHQ